MSFMEWCEANDVWEDHLHISNQAMKAFYKWSKEFPMKVHSEGSSPWMNDLICFCAGYEIAKEANNE